MLIIFLHTLLWKYIFQRCFEGTAPPRQEPLFPVARVHLRRKMLAFFLLAYKMMRTAQHNTGNENIFQTIFLDFYILWLTCAESGRGGQVWRSALWGRAEMRRCFCCRDRGLSEAMHWFQLDIKTTGRAIGTPKKVTECSSELRIQVIRPLCCQMWFQVHHFRT